MDILPGLPPHTLIATAGFVGVVAYICNYTLLSLGVIHSGETRYFVVQGFAAAMVILGLTASFNAPSMVIQVFYLAISVLGLGIRLVRRLTARPPPGAPSRSGRHWAGAFPGTGCRDRGRG